MQGLIGPLKELAEFEELCKNKKKDVGMIRVCGCVNSPEISYDVCTWRWL